MSWTDPIALTGALLAQRSLTRRAVQGASPAVFSVEAPAAAALGTWLGHGVFLHRLPAASRQAVQKGAELIPHLLHR